MDSDAIKIPDGVAFADLKLEREPFTKQLMYDPAPLANLIVANNILTTQPLSENEDLAAWLIAQWYLAHRTSGGEPDPVAEEVLADVEALQAIGIPALDPGGGRHQ